MRQDVGRVGQGRERQRPVGQDTGLGQRIVADPQRPRPVRILAVERAQGLLRSQRRGRHAVGVRVVRDEPDVAGVGDLTGGLGLRVPGRPVEAIAVRACRSAGERDDRAEGESGTVSWELARVNDFVTTPTSQR